jgi:hypothetical protein
LPTTLLLVRFLQLRRELRGLPLVHKALFIFLLVVLVLICHHSYQRSPDCWLVIGFLWLAAAFAQVYRPDKQFVYLHLNRPNLALFSEYAVLSLPLTLPAFLSQNGYCFFVYLAGLYGITFIRTSFQLQTRFVFLGKIIPPAAFEWIAGFRQGLPLLAPVYLAALAFCWVKGLPLILLWVFCACLLGFYQEGEPLQMLRAQTNNPPEFLNQKIRSHGRLLIFCCLPVILLQAVFHPWLGLAGLAFLLLQLLVLVYVICLKYSTYTPNRKNSSTMLLVSFAQISIIIPFFLLLPLALAPRQYRLAKQNLKFYFPPC